MKNIDLQIEGDLLIIKVDLTKNFGPSKSGKTTIIASTEGNAGVAKGSHNIQVGLNVYKYPPRS